MQCRSKQPTNSTRVLLQLSGRALGGRQAPGTQLQISTRFAGDTERRSSVLFPSVAFSFARISWSSAGRALSRETKGFTYSRGRSRVRQPLSFFVLYTLHTGEMGWGGIRFARPVLSPTIGSSSFARAFLLPFSPRRRDRVSKEA